MRLGLIFIFISKVAFASFIKADASYYDNNSFLKLFLGRSLIKEKREDPGINFNVGICHRNDNFGALIGLGIEKRFLEYEASFLPLYLFMKNDDIFLLNLSLFDHKTKKITLYYSSILEVLKDKNLFFIGPGILYEVSPSLKKGISLQFGNSLRFAIELIFRK